MRVRLASEPAPGRPENEDGVLHVGSLVGVLDGVTALPDLDSGCVHTPAWYVRRLTDRLAQVAGERPDSTLADTLAEAIQRVRVDHDGRCDLGNPATPAATVCLVRAASDQLDYLVLADCSLVVDQGDTVTALTDRRFGDAVAELRSQAVAVGARAPAGQPLIRKYELINQPHGYWIAAANPEAARQAVTGTLPLTGPEPVRRLALLTDGASCAVDRYALMDWPQLLDVLTDHGPKDLIRQIRQAENANPTGAEHPRYKCHDDATAALCIFEETR
jgi:hypothetical protein